MVRLIPYIDLRIGRKCIFMCSHPSRWSAWKCKRRYQKITKKANRRTKFVINKQWTAPHWKWDVYSYDPHSRGVYV